MTKKHFTAIAKILNENKFLIKRQRTNLVREMADYFQTVNPSFDRARFLAAVEE